MLAIGAPNTGIASRIRLNQDLLNVLSDVHKQRLLGIQDVTAQLYVEPFPVGDGGSSDVYRGTLRHLDAEVAVKVLRTHTKTDCERSLKRLSREALVFSNVNHPRVAKFYGFAVIGGHPAMVLEWYDQGTACDYLRDKSARQKLEIVQDIAYGLEYLHSRNIIHGDLKGSNVLINKGRAVLIDFGLSRILDAGAGVTTTSVVGSVPWLSPELVIPWLIIHNPIACSKTSDIGAFGCTAIELLFGREPYSDLSIKTGSLPWHAITDGVPYLDLDIKVGGLCCTDGIPYLGCDIRTRAPRWHTIANAIRRGVLPFQSSEEAVIPVIIKHCFKFKPSERPSMAHVVEKLS